MIEYDNFIYLDVYRTGSSHIVDLLGRICEGKAIHAVRHASLTRCRPWGNTGGKPVFATVRNPWDWYVSLWAIGADGKRPVREHLLEHKGQTAVDALYDRSDPKVSFSRWLNVMHDPYQLNTILMKEHLPQSGLAPVIGLYTYRFLRVTTRYPRFFLRRPFVNSPRGASRYHKVMRAYGTLLRHETLTTDLIAFVERHPKGFKPNAVEVIRAADAKHRNFSKRTLASYRDYYSDSDAALVAERDRFFIDVFGYGF
jgi:hypothetical protein